MKKLDILANDIWIHSLNYGGKNEEVESKEKTESGKVAMVFILAFIIVFPD